MKYKVGDEVLVKAEITKVYDSGVVIKAGGLGEAFFANENIDVNKTYSQGLADAWELARKLYNTVIQEVDEIFGVNGGFYEVMRDFTAEEALAKISEYESAKEIKVGDVVRASKEGFNGVVTLVKNGRVYVMYDDGSCGEWSVDVLTKTGKHIEGIESWLRQIGE